jgi:NADH-quinone oxidoreductase subunit C
MFGIYFLNHKDLRRILTDYGFEGFPLRKDFPLTGFLEARYNFISKTVTFNKIAISQTFNLFNFKNPWKNF